MRLIIIIWCVVVFIGGFACTNSSIIVPPPSTPIRESVFLIANPFWSADGRKILGFRANLSTEGDDFYEVDPDSGYARLITGDSLIKNFPTLSPDGQKVAYVAAILGKLLCCAHLWVMNVDGTNARDLTPFGGNSEKIHWSPDSRYLLFEGRVRDSSIVNYQIAKMDVQTGIAKLLTRGNYGSRDASFIADGKKIVYSSGRILTDYGGKVWLMDADGMNPVPIDTTPTASKYPRPSPVGNELCFVWGLGGESDGGEYSINMDNVSFPAGPSSFRSIYPSVGLQFMQWSPDGNRILYLVATSSITKDLFIMDRDGRNVQRLTTDFDVHFFSYSWSPDSRRLVFLAEDTRGSTTNVYIYYLNSLTLRKVNMSVK